MYLWEMDVAPSATPDADAKAVMSKIEDVIFNFLRQLSEDAELDLRFPIAHRTYSRDLYYQCTQLYKEQGTVDRSVTFACQLLEEPRINLHILSMAKGLMTGDVEYEEPDGTLVECRNRTVVISSQVERIRRMQGKAKFILVVEKDATFQKLVVESFCQRFGPCILMTGKGYPDIGTRVMLKKLVLTLHIPVLGLMDADPHGLEILATYKYGTKNPTYESQHLEVPFMKWVGVLRTEINELPVAKDQFIPLTEREFAKIESLKLRPAVAEDPFLMSELSALQECGTKLEIEAISGLRAYYLTDVYLPSKII